VKLDPAYVKRIADATGFDAVQLEKVIRLRQPQLRQAISIGDEAACEFPALAIEELFAGKIRAMIDRQHHAISTTCFAFAKLISAMTLR
jgi:hypothetical protein